MPTSKYVFSHWQDGDTNPSKTVTIEPSPPPSTGIYAGWRSSEYGHQSDLPTSYWINTANTIAGKLTGAMPCGIYIFGYIEGNGTGDPASAYCYLSFPKPSGTYPNVHFGTSDPHEAYLSAFDVAGLKIFLQVEPGDADVNMLMDLVMNRYKQHPCVIGFGLDLEWYQARSYTDGKTVTTAEAQSWLNHLQATHGSQYKLFLKHFSTAHVPTYQTTGLVYVDDSLGHANLEAMASEFAVWGQRYSNSDVGFQFGYQEDQNWWQAYADPFKTISQRLQSITNAKYFIWVDFTITTVFPP